jgi:hypothetical protein
VRSQRLHLLFKGLRPDFNGDLLIQHPRFGLGDAR